MQRPDRILARAEEFADIEYHWIVLTKKRWNSKRLESPLRSIQELHSGKIYRVGETIEDLQKFDSNQFVNALFDVQEDKSSPRP